jgi:hypothetical protein
MGALRFIKVFSLLLSCVVGASVGVPRVVFAFDIGGRWSTTQINGGGLKRGDPVTLRWSIVPDGKSYERSSAGKTSNLIQFLDDGWNVPAAQRTPDFTNRAWWNVINNAYAQYSRVSGITLTYVAEQDSAGVSTGQVGDIRIGGEDFNGDPGGALADNVYPDGGDMRIDTARESNGSVGSYFSTEPGLRNLVIHETGHGVGLGHSEPLNNSAKAVMEGGLRTDIWGLQFDDVYALNRQYGDPREQNGGNDTYTAATSLGNFTTGGRTALGIDAIDTIVQQFDDDWLSIDGLNDADWFSFSVTGPTFAKLQVKPIGPTYETTQQGIFNSASQNDLVMQLFSIDPAVSLIASADAGGLGVAEALESQYLVAGDYYLRVRGKQDLNQFYRVDLLLDDRRPIADFDEDGDVDSADFAFWQAGFGLDTGASHADGDADKDGDVDGQDFLFWQRQLGMGVKSLAAVQSVPEAQSLLLVVVAALVVVPSARIRL